MAKTINDRDLRSLLHVPEHDLQSQVADRLVRLGFPTLRPAQVLVMMAINTPNEQAGLRLTELISTVSLPKASPRR